ncbi:MAG TPA: YciI family protein [Thermoanaerobaculia bacterium]|nr:YciI family protein [Thermoanaerobaculia bacterium]
MAKYVLMLRDDGVWPKPGMSPEEMQNTLMRYRTWADKLRDRGKGASGHKLTGGGRVVKRNSSKVAVTDGPFSEAKEVIGGLFVIEAKDYDEALSLANDCPHLDFGSIEVREIEFTRE